MQLPAKFKSGPLNKLLGELVVLYYATWQGVENARRFFYREVSALCLHRLSLWLPCGSLWNAPAVLVPTLLLYLNISGVVGRTLFNGLWGWGPHGGG